jgi:DNA-damage-inducible protein J
MMDTYIRAKIDTDTKDKAMRALKAMGLSISDYIRMAIIQVANKEAIPFDVSVPNELTVKTIEKTEQGKEVYMAENKKDLFNKLGI